MFKLLEWLVCVVERDVAGFRRSLCFLECEDIKTPLIGFDLCEGDCNDKCDFSLRLSLRICL